MRIIGQLAQSKAGVNGNNSGAGKTLQTSVVCCLMLQTAQQWWLGKIKIYYSLHSLLKSTVSQSLCLTKQGCCLVDIFSIALFNKIFNCHEINILKIFLKTYLNLPGQQLAATCVSTICLDNYLTVFSLAALCWFYLFPLWDRVSPPPPSVVNFTNFRFVNLLPVFSSGGSRHTAS